MGSKHHSLQMGEVGDLTDILAGFEAQNNVQVRWSIFLARPSKTYDLCVRVEAFPITSEGVGARPLAWASVTCLATRLRNLRDVLIHVLYLLDGKLAGVELGGDGK